MRISITRVASTAVRVIASLNTGYLESTDNYLSGYPHDELLDVFKCSVGAVTEKS
jgi:hypothetical protein